MATTSEASRRTPATEERNPRSAGLEDMSTIQILELLNAEDQRAITAVAETVPALGALVDDAVDRVRGGGRVHYFGAGTSGRLGVLDAAELVPTFGIDPLQVQAHIAGGAEAITRAVEGSEDSAADGHRDAMDSVRSGDVVIGLAVSGTTPYVEGALRASRNVGALTGLVTSNPDSPLAELADHVVVADTGPEVLTGSTRLKAGTATKVILNGFSTTLMVRMGRTYSNLMVAVVAGNRKLRERTLRILENVTGESPEESSRLLDDAGGDLRVAVVTSVAAVSAESAAAALQASHGSVRDAIRRLTGDG
ncbi:N-acetylmuramic acid 6-phosphate etherase [Microbacterium sp. SSM24]|uniref:N-acetylmuramic acid 6-phosphate etherase n=1 Tax=Microbacterium sp. SSM24 TaxID=2991714 RepID=UPI00222736BD|nr:N-acetylmuramic acid 6-phosphate etherase [Microbacterium sp. SSM24]MCW3492563.1 N-acetylmuramic acid 6-phosphate etherase [Microbacterium sp. SSM24]